MKTGKVSLCIIAYNEETCIQDCINSVAHLVDTRFFTNTAIEALKDSYTLLNG